MIKNNSQVTKILYSYYSILETDPPSGITMIRKIRTKQQMIPQHNSEIIYISSEHQIITTNNTTKNICTRTAYFMIFLVLKYKEYKNNRETN